MIKTITSYDLFLQSELDEDLTLGVASARLWNRSCAFNWGWNSIAPCLLRTHCLEAGAGHAMPGIGRTILMMNSSDVNPVW